MRHCIVCGRGLTDLETATNLCTLHFFTGCVIDGKYRTYQDLDAEDREVAANGNTEFSMIIPQPYLVINYVDYTWERVDWNQAGKA